MKRRADFLRVIRFVLVWFLLFRVIHFTRIHRTCQSGEQDDAEIINEQKTRGSIDVADKRNALTVDTSKVVKAKVEDSFIQGSGQDAHRSIGVA